MMTAIFVNYVVTMAGIVYNQEGVIAVVIMHVLQDFEIEVNLCLWTRRNLYDSALIVVPEREDALQSLNLRLY